jgi:hypothetical protein
MPATYTRTSAKSSQTQSLTPLKRAAGGLSVGLSKENSPARAQTIPAGGARPSAKRFKTIDGASMPFPNPPPNPVEVVTITKKDTSARERAVGGEATTVAASLAAKREKEAKQASLQRDEDDFVLKYTNAFPKFVFFFESCSPASADTRIHELGGVSFDRPLPPPRLQPPSLALT